MLRCIRLWSHERSCRMKSLGSLLSRQFSAAAPPPSPESYTPDEGAGADSIIIHKTGAELLHDSVLNKGTAFTKPERDRLRLRGLLPSRVMTMEAQIERLQSDYFQGRDWIDLDDPSVTAHHVRKWRVLSELKDRNETLFYKLLLDNFTDIAPIVYTPTVGWACLNYHHMYRRPRGMFFSLKDRGDMAAMVYNWPSDEVDAIVVTDGSRILGLGDLGINGMGIPIGKLDLYVGAAGFHPGRVLPCVIDVGTDNKLLQNHPLYMGLHQPRITDQKLYMEVMDEFVRAVMRRWPRAVLQFEDFNMAHAAPLLARYRHHHAAWNDDIQGTAATALAGLYGAMEVQGLPLTALRQQKIVVVGAGSAGMGVVTMIAKGMQKQGASPAAANANFWLVDYRGLVTEQRPGLQGTVATFARGSSEDEGEPLEAVIKRVKPTILIGLAGAGPLFTPAILKAMGEANERPIIFPMSNPTSKMECSAQDAQKYTGGRAIFASGSPQANVEMDGKTIASSQANNMYIFPGLSLGAHLGQTGAVSDDMIMAAAAALPSMVPEANRTKGFVYPPVSSIRDISAKVAFEVMYAASREGLLKSPKAIAAMSHSNEALMTLIHSSMWQPGYRPLVNPDAINIE